jgi:thymidylate kinase
MDETAITTQAQNIQGPALILIRGLPGSGKTYLADKLHTVLGAEHIVMLDPDTIGYKDEAYTEHSKSLTAEGIEEKLHPYRFLRSRAHQAISDHKIIIWNQPFTLAGGFERTIQSVRGYAAEHDIQLPILAVEINIDPQIAKARIEQRKEEGGHGPSDKRFARFIDEYISFAGMGQDQTITVRGEDNVAASATAVIQALRELQR